MRRRTIVLAVLAGAAGVSLYLFIQDPMVAIEVALASVFISIATNVGMTAWEKRQGEID